MKLIGLVATLFLFSNVAVGQSPRLTRGPYLQNLLPTGITIRWRTNVVTDSRVLFGTGGQLTRQVLDTAPTTEHSVSLTGLTPATTLQYSVGSSAGDLSGGAEQVFTTAPVAGTIKPVRAWVLGDFGFHNSPNELAVRDQFMTVHKTRPANFWLWLGDNAYDQGFDDQYQQYVFDTYYPIMKSLPFWPTPGNHEYTDPTNADIAYYSLITVPQQGEAGGVPSAAKTNYSFDYANVHFVSLDSYILENGGRLSDTTGRQAQWLKRDLTANRQPWTVVFFHHPPHTKGSHNSDTEDELVQLRQKLNPILERFNVDLVLSGHSHVYERSYLMKGHYGLANTFDKAKHVLTTTTGRYDGSANSCPIINKTTGTMYIVAGSGGALGGQAADFPHPAMVYSNTKVGGSLLLDVLDNRLDAQWLDATGVVQDQFTILKTVNKTRAITANYGDTLTLTASWPASAYTWTGGQTARTIKLVATTPGQQRYTVKDAQGCLTDVFDLTFLPPTGTDPGKSGVCQLYPNPTSGVVTLAFTLPKPADVDLSIIDERGAVVQQKQWKNLNTSQQEVSLSTPGVYVFRVRVGEQVISQKVIRQ